MKLKPKNKNPQDATRRNIQAANKRFEAIEKRLAAMHDYIMTVRKGVKKMCEQQDLRYRFLDEVLFDAKKRLEKLEKPPTRARR